MNITIASWDNEGQCRGTTSRYLHSSKEHKLKPILRAVAKLFEVDPNLRLIALFDKEGNRITYELEEIP